RGELIKKFESNPQSKVFLSTESGGSGLNLQVADTLINFELPWNPAKKNQRIGRIDRLGQKAQSLLVINLISVDSIEQKIASGIVLKQNLFDAVLKEKSTNDSVDFSKKGKATFFNQLKDLMRGLDADIFKDKEINKIDINEKEDPFTDVVAEEKEVDIVKQENEFIEKKSDKSTNSSSSEHSEVLEKTLNQGLEFLSGIMQMSTGKSLNTDEKSIKVDKETGEVVMKFKLPGF
ncbi:MAG: SWF/SNF helicase family protein, partial [Spirochaetes bacterium]|nr:SWF/SNF helicase family protein [Spirochaetota bacterium]